MRIFLNTCTAIVAWYLLNGLCGIESKACLQNYSNMGLNHALILFTLNELLLSIYVTLILVMVKESVGKEEGARTRDIFSVKVLDPYMVATASFNLVGMLTTNKAYHMSSVSLVQLSKGLEPLITWILERLFRPNSSRISWNRFLGMLMTLGGIFLTVRLDYDIYLKQILWLVIASSIYPCRNVLLKTRHDPKTEVKTFSHGLDHTEKRP